MSTKPFLREPPLTTAFLLFLKWGERENENTETFQYGCKVESPPGDLNYQDKALEFVRDKDSWVKLRTLKMTLKYSGHTRKH